MGIFNNFRRKKEPVMPEEVEKYYKSQKRARVGTAWLLGFLTLIVTLAVALTLFYGARYAYRQLTDSNGSPPTEQGADFDNQSGTTPDSSTDDESQEGPDTGSDSSADESPSQTGQDEPNRQTPSSGDSLPANGDNLPAAGDPGR